MIKIISNNIEDIEQKHLVGLKSLVESRIDDKLLRTNNPSLKELLNFLKRNIDTLLCGKKSKLEEIIKEVETKYFISKRKLSKILTNRKTGFTRGEQQQYLSDYAIEQHLYNHLPAIAYSTVTKFKEEVNKLSSINWAEYESTIKEVFDYKKFSQATEDWSAYDLVSLIDINVCPYCNRSFITTLKKNGRKTRAVLDHYYAKGLYPYLALSLYNLIPSCYVCNSSFKGEFDFYRDEAMYPYEEDFLNLATFKTDFSDVSPYDYKYLLGISKEFKITLEISTTDENLKRKIKKSIHTFALEDMYNTHQDIVRDLIRNAIVNNKSRIDEILKLYPSLFNSREEVMQSLYLNYMGDQNLGKRPLSKLTQDICKEMGLLESTDN